MLTPEEVRVIREAAEESWEAAERIVADRMEEARAVRGAARLWLFGGTIALVFISMSGVGFLVWRSYHAAARA